MKPVFSIGQSGVSRRTFLRGAGAAVALPLLECMMPASKAGAAAATKWLHDLLVSAERAKSAAQGRTRLRRLTRIEYENTVRDLLDLPGITLQGELPADGSAHGFDNNSEALDISHVNLAKYIETADRALDMAIATRPAPPKVVKQRISLANPHGFVARLDGVETATASFREGRVTALIDPAKTNRARLEAALKKRGVDVKSC